MTKPRIPPPPLTPQTVPNVHDVLRAIRELEKHPAVAAYVALHKSLEPHV